ncbi:protein-arginine kinase activator protein [Alicyclobacillus contaminans]|uniref:UvrB/UvrC motif-containing protein n=1 Tax=Alicyclobacillus contaminans TaxID=392016 RepID=UPI0004050191|nr:UvrB/UvrC motif-containing protein [Alicyclobacillus contaminans]GMA50497.1 protein-arginine kinase activator protein [Alicyclobacillus contaminans]
MLCQRCHERQATVHLKKVVSGEETEYHLCEVCAMEQGDWIAKAMKAFDFNHLLSGLLNTDSSPGIPSQVQAPLRCDVCGMTYQQFTDVGRFGCPHCYKSFAPRLNALLRRIQSSTTHTGKVPNRAGEAVQRRRRLEQLRKQLNQAIAAERYEEAAHLRDQIRQLEQASGH